MDRVVVLGRGGAGKSTLAARLGVALDIPVVELDRHFWAPDLTPTPKDRWPEVQRRLIGGRRWILDGDLGPYDVLDVRLRAADTVVVLDLAVWRCAWRVLRRSRENLAFWRWFLTYRRRGLPPVMAAIARHAGHAELLLLRTPGDVERLLARAGSDRP
jgi:hypothetical protein